MASRAQRYERISDIVLTCVLLAVLAGDLVSFVQHHHAGWTLLRVVLEIGLVIFYTRQVRRITRPHPTPTGTNRMP